MAKVSINEIQRLSRDIRSRGNDKIKELQRKYGLTPTGSISNKLLNVLSSYELNAQPETTERLQKLATGGIRRGQVTPLTVLPEPIKQKLGRQEELSREELSSLSKTQAEALGFQTYKQEQEYIGIKVQQPGYIPPPPQEVPEAVKRQVRGELTTLPTNIPSQSEYARAWYEPTGISYQPSPEEALDIQKTLRMSIDTQFLRFYQPKAYPPSPSIPHSPILGVGTPVTKLVTGKFGETLKIKYDRTPVSIYDTAAYWEQQTIKGVQNIQSTYSKFPAFWGIYKYVEPPQFLKDYFGRPYWKESSWVKLYKSTKKTISSPATYGALTYEAITGLPNLYYGTKQQIQERNYPALIETGLYATQLGGLKAFQDVLTGFRERGIVRTTGSVIGTAPAFILGERLWTEGIKPVGQTIGLKILEKGSIVFKAEPEWYYSPDIISGKQKLVRAKSMEDNIRQFVETGKFVKVKAGERIYIGEIKDTLPQNYRVATDLYYGKTVKVKPYTKGSLVVQTSAPDFLGGDIVKAGKRAMTGSEDPGIYVSPVGKGMTWPLGLQGNYKLSFNLFPETGGKPSITLFTGTKKVGRIPREILEVPGFQLQDFYQSQAGKGILWIPKRTELRFGGLEHQTYRDAMGNLRRERGTGELQALIGFGEKFKFKYTNWLQKRLGFQGYMLLEGRPVFIRMAEVLNKRSRVAKGEKLGTIKDTTDIIKGTKKLYYDFYNRTIYPYRYLAGAKKRTKGYDTYSQIRRAVKPYETSMKQYGTTKSYGGSQKQQPYYRPTTRYNVYNEIRRAAQRYNPIKYNYKPGYKTQDYNRPGYNYYLRPPPEKGYTRYPPYIPPIRPPKTPQPTNKIQQEEYGGDGYDVYGKHRGKFYKINKAKTSLSNAIELGKTAIDQTTSRTFKVKKGNQLITINPTNLGTKFTQSKGRRGYYVEKSTYAIDTPGELKGITLKGWLARKKNKLFGGIL